MEVKAIAKTTIDEQDRESLLKKHYVKIFISAFCILFSGFVVITVVSLIPRPSYGDPGYSDYPTLMQNSYIIAKLLIEIGLALFSISSFLGAITDKSIADNVKRGMMIASGISILGLVIVFVYPGLYVY